MSFHSNMPMAYYSKDKEGNYLFVNSAFMIHADMEHVNDLLGKTDLELPWSEHAPCMIENDRHITKIGMNQSFLEFGLYKGNPQWCRSFKSPFLGRDGKILGIWGVSVPIQEKCLIALSKQQTACLKQLALGLTYKQIANELGLSAKTVEHYIDSIKIKLDCKSRSQLISQAIERGLISFF